MRHVLIAAVLLCAACASAGEPAPIWRPAPTAPLPDFRLAPLPPIRASFAASSAPATAASASVGGEDYVCVDGGRVHVSYASDFTTAALAFDGAPSASLRRLDEPGAYGGEGVEFRRAGQRAVITQTGAQQGGGELMVQRGDTLALISLRLYGDIARAEELARFNTLPDPDRIYPGQVLRLPAAAAARRCRRVY